MNKLSPRYLILGMGKLGSEIKKQSDWDSIDRRDKKFDFQNLYTYAAFLNNYDVIINCIGFCETYSPDKATHMNINFKAVCDLVDYCSNTYRKLVHISTDYVYAGSKLRASEEDVPVHAANWYSYSKLLADGYIQIRSKNYLLIRTSFKSRPFVYPEAYMIRGNFDYTDVIAKLIINLIESGASGVYNVGTNEKTMYQLAKQTKSDVAPSFNFPRESMPRNVSMNIDKMKEQLEKK